MAIADDGALETCDSLYVSPQSGDVALSCAARLARERGEGHRVLVVNVFGPATDAVQGRGARALRALGVDEHALLLPHARARGGEPATGLVRERGPQDDDALHRAADALIDLAHRSRAREVYVPLAVGGHVDHRLAHEAARAAFTSGNGRNVFLYEERPEAFVPGAIRVRLGQLGARLPPGAAQAPGRRDLGGFVYRFHVGPRFRGDLEGNWDRVRASWTAVREWRAGRSWHPLRALGPRLQPVTFATPARDLAAVRELEGTWSRPLSGLAARYARGLGDAVHAERYWLLLPPRDADGVETMGHGADEVRVGPTPPAGAAPA
jgi:LmbE family N-acetylglucosaminyl deacetylase